MRFLVAGDVDGDGDVDLVAAAMSSGLWLLEQRPGSVFKPRLIDAETGGFEHATHITDLDGDGKLEIYVAADQYHELRRYVWNGRDFDRTTVGTFPDNHITWSIESGVLDP